ncbi:MAG: tetratricopeptide repeat protein [Pseudobacteriovorax sp.]|nr:tetratricopeptide repeat protein [Pseudobacteriovorax sp.]
MNDIKGSVLVVSADAANQKAVIKALTSLEIVDIKVMDCGLEAMEMVKATPPALVICDVNMKQIHGWVFVKELKLNDKIPNLPIILMGRDEAPDTEDKLKSYGLVRYAKMPIKPNSLDFLIHSTVTLFKTSGTIESKFTEAKDSLIKQKNDEAIELFSELKGLTENSLRSNVGLAQAFLQDNQTEKAEEVVEEIAKSDEITPQKLFMQVRLGLKKGDHPVVEKAMKNLLEATPTEFYYSRCVKLCVDHGVPALAKPFAQDALDKGFEQIEFYNCLARCYVSDQKYEAALDYVEKAAKLSGMTPEMYNIKGVCFRKVGSHSDAISCYEEALRLDPTDAKVYFNLAICHVELKQLDLALQHLESCLEISPGFQRAREKRDEIKGKLAS